MYFLPKLPSEKQDSDKSAETILYQRFISYHNEIQEIFMEFGISVDAGSVEERFKNVFTCCICKNQAFITNEH